MYILNMILFKYRFSVNRQFKLNDQGTFDVLAMNELDPGKLSAFSFNSIILQILIFRLFLQRKRKKMFVNHVSKKRIIQFFAFISIN